MSILRKRIKRNFIIVFIILLLIIGISINTYTNKVTSSMEYYVLTDKEVTIYHNGKKVHKGIASDYNLGKYNNEDTYIMHMKIPKNNIKNPVLFFDNVNTRVKLFVDDKEIYSIGQNLKPGSTLCHANTKVPLGNLSNKKEIIMEIGVLSNTTFRGMPICTLINSKTADIYYMATSLSHNFLAIFSFILFLLGIMLVIFCGLKDTTSKKLLILSLLCLSLFIQVISAYKLIQLISDNLIIDVFFEYCTRFTTGALIGIYLYFNDESKHKKLHLIAPCLLIIHCIVATILQLLKITYLNDSLTLYIIEFVLIFIDLTITMYRNLKKKKDRKVIMTMLTSIIIFGIFAIITVFSLSKYLVIIFDLLPFFMLMIISIFYIDMVYKLYESFIHSAENKALSQLAFIDKLTNLNNRRSLDNYINVLKNYENVFALYSFDLNGLKRINDEYGHLAGDNAIKTFSTYLSNVFFDGFCTRLGGDEFVVIIEDTAETSSLIDKLEHELDIENQSNSYPYNIAFSVGKCTFTGNTSTSFVDILKTADKEMYKMKQKISKN